MNTLRCLAPIALLAVLVAPLSALADDIAPPPFRGLPNSVTAKFDLFGAPVPGGPTNFTTGANPTWPLDPLTPFVGAASPGPNNSIVYPIGLPNYIDPLPIKFIRIQYSWFSGAPTGGPVGDATALAILPSPGGAVNLVNQSLPVNIGGNIYHRWEDYEIIPNPDSERFEIAFFDADPRWVIIDTISIPEPATALLVACGFVGLATRRRR